MPFPENPDRSLAVGMQAVLESLAGAAEAGPRPGPKERSQPIGPSRQAGQRHAANGEWRRRSTDHKIAIPRERHLELWRRFWTGASGYWRTPGAGFARALTGLLLSIALLQVLVQYALNVWNRGFFDAIGRRDGTALIDQSLLFVPLAAGSVALAVAAVWGRMTLQRRWRAWLSEHLLQRWMTEDRWKRLRFVDGEHENPEFRIAEDVRIATDAPVDLALGFLTSLVTALTFIHVLWTVGGSMSIDLQGGLLVVPGYLVVGALAYSVAVNGSVLLIGRKLTAVIEAKNCTEASLRALAGRMREAAEGHASPRGDTAVERRGITAALHQVISAWQALCHQLMRVTIVSSSNSLLAPVVGLALAAPQYLAGELSLGELAQASAAFVLVSGAFNWISDNYPRLADCASSAHRVAHLLLALDQLGRVGPPIAGVEALEEEGSNPTPRASSPPTASAPAGNCPYSPQRS
jgi:vitamin B12/bleomycin/antimicrobial peptide transport system ATP-binding/permease protein